MAKILDTNRYLDTVCALLREGHTHIPVTVAGTSMTPFLDPGDTVFLDPPGRPVKKGDVILFLRLGRQYVLHRVVDMFPDGSLELLGDAQVRSEPVRPEDVFQRLTGYVRQRAVNRDVQLDIRMPQMECPVVMLDEEAYRRVCLIILENVLRRTENGGRIELSFDLERVREKKNQWILVTSVGDDGAMLSRQFVRRISERTRRDSERVLGLRLMTAKRVVQAMNGEMGVRQRPNAGMRMTVRLPADQAEPLQMMSLSHGVYGGKGLLAGMNILLAEENPIAASRPAIYAASVLTISPSRISVPTARISQTLDIKLTSCKRKAGKKTPSGSEISVLITRRSRRRPFPRIRKRS